MGPITIIASIVALLVGIGGGFLIGVAYRKRVAEAEIGSAELQAKKDAIFANEKYSKVINTKAFKKLMENSVDYSIEECEQKADEILDDYSTYAVSFASTEENVANKPKTLGFSNAIENKKNKKPYGKLFKDN